MTITMVGESERQYFAKDGKKAYITLNSKTNGKSVFKVYICTANGVGKFDSEYTALWKAQKYLISMGYEEI